MQDCRRILLMSMKNYHKNYRRLYHNCYIYQPPWYSINSIMILNAIHNIKEKLIEYEEYKK